MAATFVKYQDFVEQLCKGIHHLHAAGDTYKVILSNTAPNVATHVKRGDVTELTTGGGYTSGGVDIQNDMTETTGTATATAVDVVITASGGTIGPFRYVIVYNDTDAVLPDALVNYWDYASSITLNDGETFTIDFGASWLTVA